MNIERLHPDLHLAVGKEYQSNSLVVLAGEKALLIETTGSKEDARDLRSFVEEELKARVEWMILTHFFSDHLAGMKEFPESHVLAHRNYRFTFDSERYLTEEEKSFYVEPDILISDEMSIRWGRFHLHLFYNPGHTMSTIGIDIPEADLIHAADTVVGNIAYFWYSTPGLFYPAIERLRRRNRSKLVSSHLGVRSTRALDHALYYLTSLRNKLRETNGDAEAISGIELEECLPAEVTATSFEKIFHERNLETLVQRNLTADSFI